jgi:L-lactate dehydrogenase complex protein LldG
VTAREIIFAKLRRRSPAVGGSQFSYARDSFSEVSSVTALDRFIALATAEKMSVECLADPAEVPAAVGLYLRSQQLPGQVVVDTSACLSPDIFIDAGLAVSAPPLKPDHDTLVSGCYGAVAESGALVISTADGHAIANDFIAETHIVVLRAENIIATLADLWDSLRTEAQGGFMPREFCLVTGPSRTADLGVPAKLGAHGPARVHVLLIAAQV